MAGQPAQWVRCPVRLGSSLTRPRRRDGRRSTAGDFLRASSRVGWAGDTAHPRCAFSLPRGAHEGERGQTPTSTTPFRLGSHPLEDDVYRPLAHHCIDADMTIQRFVVESDSREASPRARDDREALTGVNPRMRATKSGDHGAGGSS